MLCGTSRSRPILALLIILIGLAAWAATRCVAAERSITVASTTSTQNSGLLEYLLPIFEKKTGIAVRVVAVGTGQAIKIAARGDADVLFVHHKPSELAFVAAGDGVERFDVMYNDFVIIGPKSDPAGIRGLKDAAAAFRKIAAAKAPFVSRGDDSGTNLEELEVWRDAGIDVKGAADGWYRAVGAGMGATLNTTSAMGGYTLSDRGTWLNFKNRGDLAILVEGDPRLFNQYGVTLVNPNRHPTVKAKEGQAFVDWLISPEGQAAIAGYKIGGESLFFPNARKSGGS
jgi:tungstate transport system substrate-binding protein